jgi:MFS family permease
MAGLTGDINLIASSIQYIINVLMTIPALIYMDRWGRRPMFVFGAVLMAIWMFTNAGLMASYGHAAPPGGINNVAEQSWVITGAPSRAVIACTYLFVASYAPTWGPASWVYPPEIFPLRVRGKAVALCTGKSSHTRKPSYTILTTRKRPIGYLISPCLTSYRLRSLTFSGKCILSLESSAQPWRSIHSSCSLKLLERR